MTPAGPVSRQLWRAVCVWTLITGGLHLAWEIGHAPLYSLWSRETAAVIVRSLAHCTIGDLVGSGGVYILIGAATRRPDWILRMRWFEFAAALLLGMVYTTWSEWRND